MGALDLAGGASPLARYLCSRGNWNWHEPDTAFRPVGLNALIAMLACWYVVAPLWQ